MTDRKFDAKEAVRGEEALLISMLGPPGGGKTKSSLRLAEGMKRVRGGDIVVLDTEGGRARKYADYHKFLHVDFQPPFQSDHFLEAIKQQLPKKPACIIVDSMSDEHVGEGGYLWLHDQQVPKMGGNEWSAWAKPSANRTVLMTGLWRIKVPLIFCFRAREKTKQIVNGNGRKEVVNIGYQPVAPAEIIHMMDLTCILPPKANGVPVWKSDKIGEDFVLKLPEYLQPMIKDGAQIDEDLGAMLAEWAMSGKLQNQPQINQSSAQGASKPKETLADRIAAFKAEIDKCQFPAEITQVKERRAAFLTWLQENDQNTLETISVYMDEKIGAITA